MLENFVRLTQFSFKRYFIRMSTRRNKHAISKWMDFWCACVYVCVYFSIFFHSFLSHLAHWLFIIPYIVSKQNLIIPEIQLRVINCTLQNVSAIYISHICIFCIEAKVIRRKWCSDNAQNAMVSYQTEILHQNTTFK